MEPIIEQPRRHEAAGGRVRSAILFLACVPALLGARFLGRLSADWPVAAGPHPYFLPAHALDLWVLAPAVALSAMLLFLLPGILLVRLRRHPGDVASLTMLGSGASLLLLIALETATKLVTAGRLGPRLLLGEWLGVTLVLALIAMRRLPSAPRRADDGRRIALMVASAWLGLAALAPKIHWESFNIDGIEAFEFGRSLSTHLLPSWDVQSGAFGLYPNFMLFAWPDHFFLSVLGPIEAAVRIPFFLWTVVILAGLISLAELGWERRLGAREELMLLASMALFTVVQAFNTNYEPFYADLAETAATDALWIACFIAAIWALWTGRRLWFWIFGLFNFTASPGGFFLLIALAAAEFTLEGRERRQKVRAVGVLLAVCVAITLFNSLVYTPFVLEGARDQFSSINLLKRLFPPTLNRWARLDTLVFATGILPVLSLFRVKRRDGLAWSTAAVLVLYFGVVYAQAWAAVHQFTPVMVLPYVVFWRCYLVAPERRRRWLVPVGIALTAICLVLSLPPHDRINLAVREVGAVTDYRFADYETDYERAAAGAHAVYWLFPKDYRLEYPNQPWGTDAYVWLRYATRPEPPGAKIAYVIQDAAAAAPAGSTLAGRDSLVAAYVLDDAVWERQREPGLPRVSMSPLYEPVLRATYRFFREYVARTQTEGAAPSGR